MLYEAKAITRRGTIDAGNTVSDFSDIGARTQRVYLAKLMHAELERSF